MATIWLSETSSKYLIPGSDVSILIWFYRVIDCSGFNIHILNSDVPREAVAINLALSLIDANSPHSKYEVVFNSIIELTPS